MKQQLQVITFLYHEVVDRPDQSGFQRKTALPYKHGIKEFDENFKVIVNTSKCITTIDHLNDSQDSPVTLLTFDDGGRSALHIADLLDMYNLKGHFFITTGMIGNRYFMNKENIIDLRKRGHIIGSHSHTHPHFFKKMTYNEMIGEWRKSKNILEQILQEEIISCSIPGGADNHNTYISARECGYKYVFNSCPFIKVKTFQDIKIIGRICPRRGTKIDEIKEICNCHGIQRLHLEWQIKEFIKTATFPIYTRILYNKLNEFLLLACIDWSDLI